MGCKGARAEHDQSNELQHACPDARAVTRHDACEINTHARPCHWGPAVFLTDTVGAFLLQVSPAAGRKDL